MNKLLRPLEALIEGLGWVARVAVLVLVLLVASNVLLRYAFSFSPVALQELVITSYSIHYTKLYEYWPFSSRTL